EAVVRVVPVDPQRRNRVGEVRKVTPRDLADLHPVMVRVEQPVLLLVGLRSRAEQRDVDDVEYAGIAAIFILAFVLRDLSVFAVAHRSHPARRLLADELSPGDAPPVQLA